MGIIGVVAALTLPNLNSSTGDKEKVAKVKKIYQNLNDAFGRAEAVYGPFDEWCVGDDNYSHCSSRFFDRITEFLKTSKKCDSVTSCEMSFDENGSANNVISYAAILADGAAIGLDAIGGGSRNNLFAVIIIDIDGIQKGKNRQGFDVFKFFVNHEEGVHVSNIMGYSSKHVTKGSCDEYYDDEAAAWIINFDNMDYLKTKDGTTCSNGIKLTVGGNHSCK